jgi:hypothetical protein
MPGRADAGNIWQACFNEFPIRYGLRQLVTDRRVWVMNSPRGILIIHDHVYDSRLTSTTSEARTRFYFAWALEFNAALESAELSEDFTGLRHRRVDALSTEISCGAVIRPLSDLIVPYRSYVRESPSGGIPDQNPAGKCLITLNPSTQARGHDSIAMILVSAISDRANTRCIYLRAPGRKTEVRDL